VLGLPFDVPPPCSPVDEEYPGVPVRKELGEHETMLSIDKARRVLGYAPRSSRRG
jgi:hypothetical protein